MESWGKTQERKKRGHYSWVRNNSQSGQGKWGVYSENGKYVGEKRKDPRGGKIQEKKRDG